MHNAQCTMHIARRPWAVGRWLWAAGVGQPEAEVGLPYIHGVEPREHPLHRPLVNFEGGTIIVGTTQSGKGVTLSVLASQAVYRGDVVIIIDPKNSNRLKSNVVCACQEAGRADAFLEFHPAFPERGVRFDPLFNWQKPTELASRIQSVMSFRRAPRTPSLADGPENIEARVG